jgi:hypothetical protein
MWKNLLFLLFASCLPCAVPAAEQWYLIQESELRSIEEYRKNSEAEKLTWLSQVQTLRAKAGNLEAESVSLNNQLWNQRERNQKLTRLFNEYEQDQSLLMSRKDTLIIELEAENKTKNKVIILLAVTVAGIVILFAVKSRMQ